MKLLSVSTLFLLITLSSATDMSYDKTHMTNQMDPAPTPSPSGSVQYSEVCGNDQGYCIYSHCCCSHVPMCDGTCYNYVCCPLTTTCCPGAPACCNFLYPLCSSTSGCYKPSGGKSILPAIEAINNMISAPTTNVQEVQRY